MRQKHDRFGHVPYLMLDEVRLIVRDQCDHVSVRYVAKVDNGESVRVEVESYRLHTTARNGRPHRSPVQHARKHQIVGEERGTSGLANAVLARNAVSDGSRSKHAAN